MAAPRTVAQEPDHRSYANLVSVAIEEFNRGAWAEAYVLFQNAHALAPNARTWRALGMTSFEQRHYVAAVAELESARVDTRNPLTQEQRVETDAVIARARGFIDSITIDVSPKDAQVLLDGTTIRERKLQLNAGEYELRAVSPDHNGLALKLQVQGGRTRTIRIDLVPTIHARAVARRLGPTWSTIGADRGDLGTLHRVLGWSALAGGAAGVGLGAIFEFERVDKLRQRDAICPASVDCMPGDDVHIARLESAARSARTLELIGFAAGGLLTAAGLVALLTAPSSTREDQPKLSIISPGAGVSLIVMGTGP